MLQHHDCPTMSIQPSILSKVTHLDSLAAQIHLDQAITVGSRNRMTDYEAHAPDIVALANQVEVLASNASRVELHSDDAAPVESMAIKIHGARRFAQSLTTARMMSVMLGRKRMLLSHTFASYTDTGVERANVDGITARKAYSRTLALPISFFLQPLPFFFDSATGEIHDDIALRYIQEVKNKGFLGQLYRLSETNLCAVVMLGSEYEHGAAVQIAKILASFSPGVRVGWSSLVEPVHCPLSLNAECELCAWYGQPLEDSSSILQSLIDYVAAPVSLDESFSLSSAPQIQHDDLVAETEEELSLPDELPDLPDLNEQPVRYPKDWIVSAAFRRQCIEALGTEDPGALKLLGMWLWGWRDDATKLPIASNETLASLLGWESRIKGKRQVVKPALDMLQKHTQVKIKEHNYKGRATCFDLPDIPFKLIDLGQEYDQPVIDPVLLGTGARIREHITRQDEWRRSVAGSSSTNYPSDVSARLILSLNNLPANYFRKLTTTHWETLMERVYHLESESQVDALRSLRSISFFPQPIYKRATNTSRIYTVGYSYQTLQRDLRNVVFSGCLKVDLRHSQLSIACWMYGFHELDALLNDGTAWTYLCGESGLSKDKIKTILYATLFMRSLEFDPYCHPALKNPLVSRDDLRRFIGVKELRALIAARTRYINNGLENVEKDAFGNALKTTDYNVRLASLSQSYELKILTEAIIYVTNLKSNNICLWLHDGFFVNGNQTKFSGISNNLTKIVDKSLKEHGIISALESSFPMS
jgi:hypothetical protein